MKKLLLLLLLLPALLAGSACNRLSADEAEQAVVSGEMERLPLLKQQVFVVEDIIIDSIRLVADQEPMSGFLYTTWTTGENSYPIIVAVTDIRRCKENRRRLEWNTDWESATRAYLMKSLMGPLSD